MTLTFGNGTVAAFAEQFEPAAATVDGVMSRVHGRNDRPRFSHIFNGSSLNYEIAIPIRSPHIVRDLVPPLGENEPIQANNSYVAEAPRSDVMADLAGFRHSLRGRRGCLFRARERQERVRVNNSRERHQQINVPRHDVTADVALFRARERHEQLNAMINGENHLMDAPTSNAIADAGYFQMDAPLNNAIADAGHDTGYFQTVD